GSAFGDASGGVRFDGEHFGIHGCVRRGGGNRGADFLAAWQYLVRKARAGAGIWGSYVPGGGKFWSDARPGLGACGACRNLSVELGESVSDRRAEEHYFRNARST